MHMDSLLPYTLQSAAPTGQNTPIAVQKSGIQTPAPEAKVLRWKDLETAVVIGQPETAGAQTPNMRWTEEGTPGLEMISNEGDSDIEDLFV